MKSRILDSLYVFSKMEVEEIQQDALAKEILKITQTPLELFSKKASEIHHHLLTNYALFSVETIDHFNHRLIRTFAKDLKLSQNFEVYLDTPLLLAEAVDNLIEKAGEDPEITHWLLRFALEKTEADKSWDIAFDLNKVAGMLLKEVNFEAIEALKEVPLSAFDELQKELQQEIEKKESACALEAKEIHSLITQQNLDRSHFSRGYVYDFLKKIAANNFKVNLDAGWIKTLGEKNLYPARVSNAEAERLEALTPKIIDTISSIKKRLYQVLLNKNILQNLIPLATLHLIWAEVEGLKEEQNILPISEFNKIIYHEIKDQPTPFIYERLGERYRHFFIDEFQDTSKMQWNNLVPLIENTLVQESFEKHANSVLLVGDSKQSIYRWRGGFPEQFMGLIEKENPFQGIDKKVMTLEHNYRSCAEIIKFNNDFFQHTATLFKSPVYKDLYIKGTQQLAMKKEQGYVQIDFISGDDKEKRNLNYIEKTLQHVQDVLQRGYPKESICILVRKKEEGILISDALNKQGIGVASEETLLLSNSAVVNAVVAFLKSLVNPSNEEAKLIWLSFIHEHLSLSEPIHDFLQLNLKKTLSELSINLEKLGILINLEELLSLSAYEVIEQFIGAFQLAQKNDPFLTDFVNWAFTQMQHPNNHLLSLIEDWEIQKEKLSLQAAVSDAIQVMTIHKSKGLEFPVVIFPFAEVDLYYEKEASVWYPLKSPSFEKVPIQLKKEVTQHNDVGASLYHERQETLELDNINLLYVVLTRAQTELYIIGKEEKTAAPLKNYSQLLKNYLEQKQIWEASKTSYSFGNKTTSSKPPLKGVLKAPFQYYATRPSDTGIRYAISRPLSEEQEGAISFGNLMHDILSKVVTGNEINTLFEDELLHLQDTNPELFKHLKTCVLKIRNHPELQSLFNIEDRVYNERDMITSDGVIRPDRLNIHNSESITIVDYKTGLKKAQDEAQIDHYGEVLSTLGYSQIKKILVYINDHDIVVNKSYI